MRTRQLEIAFALLRRLGAAPNLTTNAQLAALAIEQGAELHSNDSAAALDEPAPLSRLGGPG